LDATWASGYVTYSSDFVQLYNPFYYLTPPEDFIRDHYPEDLSWTLLSSPPTLREFHYTPFKNQAYLKHKIVSFKPANGIIEASVGDTINFELETEAPEKKLWISDTAYIDTAAIPIIPVIDSTKTVSIVSGNKVSVKYFVVAENAQWLNLILNNDAVLRYRLKIKKNYTALK
jgi:transglutaminase/protease-like cytokinesis protein 3